MTKLKIGIINDTGGRGHYGCDLVMSQLESGIRRAGGEIAWSHPVGVDWRPLAKSIASWAKVDAIVVNGEGSIHNSAVRDRAVYLSEFAKFSRDTLNVPAFLINSTIYNIEENVARNIASYNRVFVRDTGSLRELTDFGITSKYVPDLTTSAEFSSSGRRKGIVVIDSVLPEVNSLLERQARNSRWQFRSMHEKPSRWKFWKRRENFADFLSRQELVITGRYHSVTMCIATKTPFVAIESNTPKTSWLLNDVFGNAERVFSVSALTDLDVSKYSQWSEKELLSIDQFLAMSRASSMAMFDELINLG